MARRSASLWLLVLEVVALQHMCLGSSSHSLKVIYYAVLEPSRRLSQFVIQGYVDGQIFSRYDSNSRKIHPRVPWMEKSGKDIPQYWQTLTDIARTYNDLFRERLENPRTHYNQSKDLRTLQGNTRCELSGNGSERYFWTEEVYNGEIKATVLWSKYLSSGDCIGLLERCLSYGNETLMRTEIPVVTVSSRSEVEDGMETHVCRVHGFYPREIDASWRRDGEVWLEDTFHGFLTPNADGTYYYWLSIQIDSKERDRYRCHVEHDSLQEPLEVALKAPESNLGLIIGCVVAGLVLVGVIVGSLIFLIYSPPLLSPALLLLPQEEEFLGRDFLQCLNQIKLSLPFGSFSRLATLDDIRMHFFYWPIAGPFWIVALFITVSASFFALDFRRGERRLRMAGRMALRFAPLLFLALLMVDFPESSFGSSLHSLKHFSACTSEFSQGQPHFFLLGYVDDQVFVHYDSNSQRMQPRVSWMEKIKKEDPQLWDRETQSIRDNEELSRTKLEFLRSGYNQSEGFHTLQWMYGCELRSDGSKEGLLQYAYDGRTFIAFDKENLTWVAHQPLAQIIKKTWDDMPGSNQGWKSYLEEDCIEWLQKHLSYGKEMLLRTDSPVVTVSSRMETEDGMETHVCRIDGFYPQAIDASWTRDGKVWLQDTFHGTVVPNADGTYHCWLSIQIYPNDSDQYRCHVEHDGLQEPLNAALKAPKSNKGFNIGYLVAGLVLACVIVGTLIPFKKLQAKYRRAPSPLEDRLTSSSL
ncbi:uncharacterized protein LOC131190460 [Ahaetulla prasina]|uniref:uncharacterized protein LOC131190460 n=1 Tax=Ahaetulla prasina TaxID=499056 RepID=UPI0026496C72|nr:uncharacterized protein LOC131190460 [Ahaetulla prasina]